MKTAMVSGHLDLSEEEFETHYVPLLDKAILAGDCFVVGDARGADSMAQLYLFRMRKEGHLSNEQTVTVYHAYRQPRNNFGFENVGLFESQTQKDKAMTLASDYDLLWVREGRESSGTARNAERRKKLSK